MKRISAFTPITLLSVAILVLVMGCIMLLKGGGPLLFGDYLEPNTSYIESLRRGDTIETQRFFTTGSAAEMHKEHVDNVIIGLIELVIGLGLSIAAKKTWVVVKKIKQNQQ